MSRSGGQDAREATPAFAVAGALGPREITTRPVDGSNQLVAGSSGSRGNCPGIHPTAHRPVAGADAPFPDLMKIIRTRSVAVWTMSVSNLIARYDGPIAVGPPVVDVAAHWTSPHTGRHRAPDVAARRTSPRAGRRRAPDIAAHRTSPRTGRRRAPDVAAHWTSPRTGRRRAPDVTAHRTSSRTGRRRAPDVAAHRTSPRTG